MELLNRYLQAVGFWLPRKQKQDILAELSEDLRSQIEDKEAEFGRPLSEGEIETILKHRGRPIMVAGAYLPKQSLIGPVLFPSYKLTLKIAGLCYCIPWLLVWIGFLIFDPSRLGAPSVSSLLHSLVPLWTTVWTIFGAVTFVFAIFDRAAMREKLLRDWEPRKLPKVRIAQQKRRRDAIAGIVFGVFGLIWLLAVPNFPFLILGPGALILKAAPIWQTVYFPILLVASAGIAEHSFTLVKPQLTWTHMVLKLATTGLNLWIIRLLSQTRTYLLPTDPHTAQVAAAVNLAIPISLVCVAVGLGISMLIYIWQFIREPKGSERIQSQGIFQI